MADRTSTEPKRAANPPAKTSIKVSRPAGAKSAVGARPAGAGKHFLSDKVGHFTESVIREMTRQAMLHGAINLAQGFPDFSAPAEVKQAAQEAIGADVNQYAITWGAKSLRAAIARQMKSWQGVAVDPDKQVT